MGLCDPRFLFIFLGEENFLEFLHLRDFIIQQIAPHLSMFILYIFCHQKSRIEAESCQEKSHPKLGRIRKACCIRYPSQAGTKGLNSLIIPCIPRQESRFVSNGAHDPIRIGLNKRVA
eukprot:Lithocolla_globosa_v1_NODE_3387_length_1686_cov_2.572042.p2 type:complete len:118 gc:universal NODE_3387_length_1686_cov_2.572042:1686-1333(-)